MNKWLQVITFGFAVTIAILPKVIYYIVQHDIRYRWWAYNWGFTEDTLYPGAAIHIYNYMVSDYYLPVALTVTLLCFVVLLYSYIAGT